MPSESDRHDPARRASLVDLPQGRLEGRIEDGLQVFRGIPYAAAPVGRRRFRPAEPPEPWTGVRQAVAFAPAAPQLADPGFYPGDPEAMPRVATDEDCLHLNVWAPAEGTGHPVLVWLHGGAQIVGGTARPVYDGAVFARRGIVCVTVGFRLGALGYLELGALLGRDFAGSGNAALTDQIAALRWVRTNVAAFGGDPERVTLAGESAGAKNIAALMTAPAADGLFGAAIVQSGGGETTHDVATAEGIAARFVALSGRSGAAELATLPIADFLDVQRRLLEDDARRFPFRPVHGTPLLPARPLDTMRSGSAARRALLIGTSRDENGPMIDDETLLAGWRGPLLTHLSAEEMTAVEARALPLLGALPIAELRRRLLVAEEYRLPAMRFARAHAASGAATWVYRFDLALPSGPFAGSAPHTAELGPSWAQAGLYDALPDRPAAAMHETIVGFVRRWEADWPRYQPPRHATALFDRCLGIADDPERAMLDLFADPVGTPPRRG